MRAAIVLVHGPVVLVWDSYGGAVISNVPTDAGDITGLVYVADFAPEPGESCITLVGRFPGSALGDALQPVRRADGATDLYMDARPVPSPSAAQTCPHRRPR